MISQDRQEIYINMATYDDDYIRYINKMQSRSKSFLYMTQCGPFFVDNKAHMYYLGRIMLALSFKAGRLSP